MVKRYDYICYASGNASCYREDRDCRECQFGALSRRNCIKLESDYAALSAERDRLREDNRRLREGDETCDACGELIKEDQKNVGHECNLHEWCAPEEDPLSINTILKEAGEAICSSTCPSTWKTGEGQPHSDLCRKIRRLLREPESH